MSRSYRKVRSEWASFAFPKKEKKSIKPKSVAPERVLQEQANCLYDAMQIKFLRLWDELFSAITMSTNGARFWLMKELKGWPDNMLFIPIGDKYNLVFCPELKRKGEDLNAGQRDMARKINMVMIDDFDELEKQVKKFVKDAEKLNGDK